MAKVLFGEGRKEPTLFEELSGNSPSWDMLSLEGSGTEIGKGQIMQKHTDCDQKESKRRVLSTKEIHFVLR